MVQVVEQQVPGQASAIVSFGFSPPEQIARKPVGFFSDIYALGATCVALLTNENPDDVNVPYNLSVWKEHAAVSPAFAAILDKMLAPRVEDRYQSAEAVLQALNTLDEERRRKEEERRRQAEEEERRRNKQKQQKKMLLAIGFSGLGLLVLSLVGIMIRKNTSELEQSGATLPPAQLMSAGEKLIDNSIISLSDKYEDLKLKGIEAFADRDYETARDTFADIRRQAKEEWQRLGNNLETPYGKALQDPTVLIAQNNAEARLRHRNGEPIYTVVAAVPLNINIGKQMLFGIAQAQDQAVNSQAGEPINLEIIIANDRNDPEQAAANARLSIEDTFDGRRILAVIGHYTSDSTCAALKHYAPASIPVVSPLSTAANIRQDCDGNGWFFRTTSSTRVEAGTLVNYLTAQISRPKVAIFYNKEDTFSRNLFNEFQSILNNKAGEAVATFDLSEKIDVGAKLSQVEDVDALAVLPDGRTRTDAAFNQAVEVIQANRGEKLILGSNPLYDQSVIDQAGLDNIRSKLILATDWYRECALEGEGRRFVDQAEQEYWYGGVNRTTALSYEAVQAVLATLAPGVTPTQIQQKLATGTPIQSDVFADESLSFDENGDRRELTQRILTTPGNNPRSPFDLVQGCPE
ncbi:MAG: ABC transporter substrate-binding protein [Cyanobacteria bacterium RM1_2_2]|nr:ABC transporter substrate-binding protein [Cyanobacteria bacterium RM1_2_2]